MAETLYQHLTCRQENGILVITLTVAQIQGDDLADILRKEFLEALAQAQTNKLVLDFRHVKFLTSTAFRPLLSLHRKLQEIKGRMVFCNLADELAEVFIVTRLISTTRSFTAPFELATDLADALARLQHHTRRMQQGVLVLTLLENKLRGDDLAESLTQALLASVGEVQAKKVVLDLAQVEVISTPCIRSLVALRKHLYDQNGRLLLCNLHPMVEEILRAMRLIAANGAAPGPLETVRDLPAALAALRS